MSEQNLSVIHHVYEAMNAGDVDRALEVTHPEFEMDWTNSIGPQRGIYRGRDRALELWRSFQEAFEGLSWHPLEMIELDTSRVLVVNRVRMRGRGSGVGVDATGAQLWTFSDGLARRVKLYQSKQEALEAVGRGDGP